MLRDNFEMTQSFLAYVTREFPSLENLTPFSDDDDEWPAQFNDDKTYLAKIVDDLKKESKSVLELVCNN